MLTVANAARKQAPFGSRVLVTRKAVKRPTRARLAMSGCTCAKATNDAPYVAFRAVDGVGSAFGHRFEAQSHSLFARYLHFAARITTIEHHTRLASHWRPTSMGRDSHPLGC